MGVGWVESTCVRTVVVCIGPLFVWQCVGGHRIGQWVVFDVFVVGQRACVVWYLYVVGIGVDMDDGCDGGGVGVGVGTPCLAWLVGPKCICLVFVHISMGDGDGREGTYGSRQPFLSFSLFFYFSFSLSFFHSTLAFSPFADKLYLVVVSVCDGQNHYISNVDMVGHGVDVGGGHVSAFYVVDTCVDLFWAVFGGVVQLRL